MRAPYKQGRHLRRNVEFVQLNCYWDVFGRTQYCKMGQRRRMTWKQEQAPSNFIIMQYLLCLYALHVSVTILLCSSLGLYSVQMLKV
jgi:hypothetical protein